MQGFYAPPLTQLAAPRNIARQFTPNWFAVTMGTGILSVALSQFPGEPILHVAGNALWQLNIVLFAVLLSIYLWQWMFYPAEAIEFMRHPVVSMSVGCLPMGLATIINGLMIYGPQYWGDVAIMVAETLWWVDVAIALLCGLVVPFLMFTHHSHKIEHMTAVWLLPVVACEVAAVSGGLLVPHLADASEKLTILLASYALWACSVPLAMGILVILFMRMVLHKLPPVAMAPTSWLALGPIGTGALGLIVLGHDATATLQANGLGAVAEAFGGASLLGGVMLWGYGLWWLVTAVMVTLHYMREGMPFNLGWWGYTFPLGVYAVATLRLGSTFNFAPISNFGYALVAALAILWVVIMIRTVRGAWHGYLFFAPEA
ncbi:TDT family transporter [Rhizobium sp. BK251]|uniref:TDT family transporter n=1 Tax=Rhizobium sp. BK251 TaxID=2512125 RepID=UPI0010495B67|nr:TDT family transporter [Rhizobium sp. BK251]TCL71160.1 C4-dicarboxylate transporter/malic acid transport protein [Rhizobium sp. BK251]